MYTNRKTSMYSNTYLFIGYRRWKQIPWRYYSHHISDLFKLKNGAATRTTFDSSVDHLARTNTITHVHDVCTNDLLSRRKWIRIITRLHVYTPQQCQRSLSSLCLPGAMNNTYITTGVVRPRQWIYAVENKKSYFSTRRQRPTRRIWNLTKKNEIRTHDDVKNTRPSRIHLYTSK